jgi:hypothetical protein
VQPCRLLDNRVVSWQICFPHIKHETSAITPVIIFKYSLVHKDSTGIPTYNAVTISIPQLRSCKKTTTQNMQNVLSFVFSKKRIALIYCMPGFMRTGDSETVLLTNQH